MTILTRYLFSSILKPLLFCMVSFFALWLIYDLFDTLPEFIQQQASPPLIFKFYAAQLPKIAQGVIPIAFFFATLYVLTSLSKSQEIIMLQASGQNIVRICWPFFAIAMTLSLALWLLNITLTPQAEISRRAIRDEMRPGKAKNRALQAVVYRNPGTGTVWFMQTISPEQKSFEQAEILLVNLDGGDQYKLFAKKGTFQDGQWHLDNVLKITFRSDGSVESSEMIDHLTERRLIETPEDLVYDLTPPDQMSWPKLRHYLTNVQQSSSARKARYTTEYYERFFYPLICPVLCLFAVALGIQPGRRSIAGSLFNSIFLLFVLLIWHNLWIAMGKGGRVPPWLAASSAILLFGLIGTILFAKRVGWSWLIWEWCRPTQRLKAKAAS